MNENQTENQFVAPKQHEVGLTSTERAAPPVPLLEKEDSIQHLASSAQHQVLIVAAPISQSQTTALIESKPLPAPAQTPERRKIRRHGRVASLPKTERDMVNRMLLNGIPYKNIVAALGEIGYTVTERNISNWATGGYVEWRLEQDAVTHNRLDQDHLVDFLRRDDAQELPEVGLQAAATRLSQVLLQKLARADDPESQLDSFSRMIDLLCRLNREISATQKQRNESRRVLGPEYNPVVVKDTEQMGAIEMERFYSNPPENSPLPRPAQPPSLPPIPTAATMARQNREERLDAELRHEKEKLAFLKKVLGKDNPTPAPPADPPATPAKKDATA